MSFDIKKEVQLLLQKLCVFELPISVTYICKFFGIEIIYDERLEGIDSYCLSGNAKNLIFIENKNQNFCRQRFSASHEFAHIWLGHNHKLIVKNGIVHRIVNPKDEREANMFASELLMPEFLLRQYDFLLPEEIAKICKVSLPAAKIRAEELEWAYQSTDKKWYFGNFYALNRKIQEPINDFFNPVLNQEFCFGMA